VVIDGTTERRIFGTYLDLQLGYTPRGLLLTTKPKLISPIDANGTSSRRSDLI
jgi:hypothetical protein